MTKAEFFEVLKQTDRRWVVLPDGKVRARRLRRGGRRDCPITAVALLQSGKKFNVWRFNEAAESIKLGATLADNLTIAADMPSGELRPVTEKAAARHRKELFKLLNLPANKL
jgi:hypothetical protein